jgi:hypothetical protein
MYATAHKKTLIPTKKDEAWKYTAKCTQNDFTVFQSMKALLSLAK